MKKRTIESLNETIWYRALKVGFVLLFLFLAIVVGALTFTETSPDDILDYEVACNYEPNKESFIAEQEGIFIFGYIPGESFSELGDTARSAIRTRCDPTGEIVDGMLDRIIAGEDVDPLYTIEYGWYTEGTWEATIGYTLLAMGAVIVVFEILRRLFYYIILGTFRPRKERKES